MPYNVYNVRQGLRYTCYNCTIVCLFTSIITWSLPLVAYQHMHAGFFIWGCERQPCGLLLTISGPTHIFLLVDVSAGACLSGVNIRKLWLLSVFRITRNTKVSRGDSHVFLHLALFALLLLYTGRPWVIIDSNIRWSQPLLLHINSLATIYERQLFLGHQSWLFA